MESVLEYTQTKMPANYRRQPSQTGIVINLCQTQKITFLPDQRTLPKQPYKGPKLSRFNVNGSDPRGLFKRIPPCSKKCFTTFVPRIKSFHRAGEGNRQGSLVWLSGEPWKKRFSAGWHFISQLERCLLYFFSP